MCKDLAELCITAYGRAMRTRISLFAALVIFICIGNNAKGNATAELEQQRTWFRQAWQAAARGQWQAVARLEQKLGDYPLTPYLRAEQLRRNPALLSAAEMNDYIQRYQGWSFVPGLKRHWLQQLARQRDHHSLALYGQDTTRTELICEVIQAQIQLGNTKDLIPRIQQIWLHGESLPRSCDAPFRWLKQQQGITQDMVWQRTELALNNGNYNLSRYLKRFLEKDSKPWVDYWIQLARYPLPQLKKSLKWTDSERARYIVSWTVQRLARKEVDDAASIWPALTAHFQFDTTQRHKIERDIALFKAVRLTPDAIQRIDALSNATPDQQLLAWRTRVALAEENWSEVANSIQAMAPSEAQTQRWQYWFARSLEAQAITGADNIYSRLAQQANYFGFLAADRLQQPYAICPQSSPEQDEWAAIIAQHDLLQRALELKQVGLDYHARATWRQATKTISKTEAVAAAAAARAINWDFQSIMTLAAAGATQHYDWRFPRHYQQDVTQFARFNGLEPAMVYGIIRAESALRADAISGAGARGLMQLMPATAQQVARQEGIPYQGKRGLLNPTHNLQLGTAYFSKLTQHFTGSVMLAAGAYNAGPNIVDKWLQERPQVSAADIWPEIIPYHETRDYIPNVLAFSVIYDWLINDKVTPISSRLRLSWQANQNTFQVASKVVACPTERLTSTLTSP